MEKKVTLNRINIDIQFPEDFILEEVESIGITKAIEKHTHQFFIDNDIARFTISVISEQKHKAEILYESGKFRIITTKTCKALVQEKHLYNNNTNEYFWKDKAWFGSGTNESTFKDAMEEVNRLGRKGSKRKKSDKPTKRDSYIKNLPSTDKDLLNSLLGVE